MNLTKEQLNQKYKNTIQILTNLEEKWFAFVREHDELAKLILIDPDGNNDTSDVPVDVQYWNKKYYTY